jgi:hypothetical protein
MNVKMVVGVVLFVIGLVAAVAGIVGVAMPEGPDVTVRADYNEGALERMSRNIAIPLIAGLSLGIGGLLIGLSMGDWKHPRTSHKAGDEVVNPEGYHKMKHV